MNATKTPYFINRLFLATVSPEYKKQITAIPKNHIRLLLVVCLILNGLVALSQKKDSLQPPQQKDSLQTPQQNITGPQQDTLKTDLVNQLKQLGFSEAKKGMRKFQEDRIETKQEKLIKDIHRSIEAATGYLETGVDTTGLNKELADIDRWYHIVSDGVFINRGTIQTKGNLEVSGKILKELLTRLQHRQTTLNKYYEELLAVRNKIDSLSSDSSLYQLSSDSATATRYIGKIIFLASEVKPADSTLKQAMTNISSLETKINLTANKLSRGIKQIEKFEEDLFHQYFKKELPNLDQPAITINRRSLTETLRISTEKAKLSLYFYIIHNTNGIVMMLLLIVGCNYFLRSLKQRLKEKGVLKHDYSGQLVLRYPVLSAILLVFSLFQFIFLQPVFAFSFLIWMISAICLTTIFRGYISRYWMSSWLIMFLLFLLACGDNFISQSSRPERWFMFGLSIAGVISGLVILFKGRKGQLKEKWIIYFMMLTIIMEGASAVLNFYGRYNISKTLLTNGFLNVVIGLLFLWVVRFINECSHSCFPGLRSSG